MSADVAIERPPLKLEIGYTSFPDAQEAGRIFEQLATAFLLHSGRSRHVRLVVARMEIGSIRAWLDLAGAVETLYEQRTVLSEFVRDLAVNAQILAESGAERVPASLRKFLTSFAKPVAEGRASHSDLHVHGDNTTVLFVSGTEAIKIMRKQDQNFIPQNEYHPPGKYTRWDDGIERTRGPVVRTIKALSGAGRKKGSKGRLRLVDDKLFVQPDGFGFLLPAIGSGDLLMANIGNRVSGRIVHRGGIPWTFEIKSAEAVAGVQI